MYIYHLTHLDAFSSDNGAKDIAHAPLTYARGPSFRIASHRIASPIEAGNLTTTKFTGPDMSAPSIPNLLSLRGRGGGRGRSRGRGQGPGGGTESRGRAHDATIQGTDTDAAVSRLSAVDMGYLNDPYARYFVSSLGGPPARRFPIINRG